MPRIPVHLIEPDIGLPDYAHPYDAGADLRSRISCVIEPAEAKLVPTGIRVAVPQGYELQVRPRSGLALKHGVTVLNTPGTVDSGYRGEVGVILINHGLEPFMVKRGDRIAQLVLARVETASYVAVESLPESERGDGGFGSTGV